MKKLFALLLVLVLAFSFAACSQNPPQTDPEQNEQTTPEGLDETNAMDSLIDWMKDGTFSYDFEMNSEYEGEIINAIGSLAIDGENYAMSSETTIEGVATQSRIIIVDGVTNIIDDTSKMIIKTSGGGMDMTKMPTEYEGMELINSGEGTVNGKNLPYEEYMVEGVAMKIYMENGTVYAIESEYEGSYTLMIISNAKNTVPGGVFDLPEGYQEMSY